MGKEITGVGNEKSVAICEEQWCALGAIGGTSIDCTGEGRDTVATTANNYGRRMDDSVKDQIGNNK